MKSELNFAAGPNHRVAQYNAVLSSSRHEFHG